MDKCENTLPDNARKQRQRKVIAFYLPQFHPIPENDRWWGAGFTEWTNVTRSRPLYEQHYQPRRPGSLGYYDLRLPEVRSAQADLAKKYGLYGFAYYYYWFDGKRLLNQPIESVLADKNPDFPFCICWANENWSRNWDGQNKHVLMAQNYSMDSCERFINDVIPFLKDSRYIRFNDKPVLIVYRITQIPNWRSVARMWRQKCREAGVGEIHLCAVRFGLEPLEGHPVEHALDSYVLFPPHESVQEDWKHNARGLPPEFGGQLLRYDAMVDGDVERFERGYPWPVHRGATMGWDNTARRGLAARIFQGATPARFRYWLKQILRQDEMYNTDEESLVFINAWNEWAEGTVLEPDERWGEGYLEAVQSALQGSESACVESGADINISICFNRLAVDPIIENISYDKLDARQWKEGEAKRNSDSKTILLVGHISGHQLYGGERSLLDVLKALWKLNYNVIVCLPSGNNVDYINNILKYVIGVYVFHYPQWRDNRDPIERIVIEFQSIMHEHNVDVLHANTITHLEALEAARRSEVTRVVHVRELITMDEDLCSQIGKKPEDIIAHVLKSSDYIISNSSATAHIFMKPGKCFTIPNAIDSAMFPATRPSMSRGKLRFGIVSNNLEKKGVGDVINVARRLGERDDLEFVIVGPERECIRGWKSEVKSGQLPSTLRFIGYQDTPAQAMAQFDVLLSLSHFAESFGRTVAEAAACGKPAIAYHWGALPELIDHEETGHLVGYRDIDGVARSVDQFATNRAMVRSYGSAAKAKIKKTFSVDALGNKLGAAYKVILDGSLPKGHNLRAPIVVVPIFNAYNEVMACIETLKLYTPNLKAVLINDASTDSRIEVLLKSLEADSRFTLLRNESNLGYTRSVNRAIATVPDNDVVLLNSDVRVTPNWLDGLIIAALSGKDVGTVTAMSDNAGAFSFPVEGTTNARPRDVDEALFSRIVVQATGRCRPVEVPTGSGFCMYIKRDLINAIGVFDEEAFPRGYGEENDFCMRARAAGWKSLVTPWTYVYHERSASFGAERDQLVKAGVDLVIKRFPDYPDSVRAAFSGSDMLSLRAACGRLYGENFAT